MVHDGAFDCTECGGAGALIFQTDVDDGDAEPCGACGSTGAQPCVCCDDGLAAVQAGGEYLCHGCAASAREAA
jgi:hypothetical protein